MRIGAGIVVTENVIVVGGFGSELLAKGTTGTLLGLLDDQAEIQTKHDTYVVPLASIGCAEDAAA